jgi:hypothetical protein
VSKRRRNGRCSVSKSPLIRRYPVAHPLLADMRRAHEFFRRYSTHFGAPKHALQRGRVAPAAIGSRQLRGAKLTKQPSRLGVASWIASLRSQRCRVRRTEPA